MQAVFRKPKLCSMQDLRQFAKDRGIRLPHTLRSKTAIIAYLKGILPPREVASVLELGPGPGVRITHKLVTYYKKYHGFDIRKRRKRETGKFVYEHTFPLVQDKALHAAGVTIGARVEFDSLGKRNAQAKNRIIFRNRQKVAMVHCVHTAICQMSIERASYVFRDPAQAVQLSRTAIPVPATLIPEEHFVSLKSYVGGIAELGLEQTILASFHSEDVNPESLPFGFNSAMQSQIIQSLRVVAPVATKAFVRGVFLNIIRSVPVEWFNTRISLLSGIYGFRDLLVLDPETFFLADDILHSKELHRHVLQQHPVHPAIVDRIFQEYAPFPQTTKCKNTIHAFLMAHDVSVPPAIQKKRHLVALALATLPLETVESFLW